MNGLVYTHDDLKMFRALTCIFALASLVLGVAVGKSGISTLSVEQERKAYYAARFEQQCDALQFYRPMNEAPETPMKVRDNE